MNFMKKNLKGSNVRPTLSKWGNMNVVILVALVLNVLFPYAAAYAELPAPKLNHQLTQLARPVTAPDFSLEDMDGEIYTFKNFRGQVIMINFWATWCPPCRREMPSMEYLYQAFKNEAFTVLAVNQWETPDHVFAFMGELEVFPNYPILFDTDSTVSGDYEVKGLPTTVLIDKQGRIVYRAVGGRDFNHPAIKKIVSELLAVPVDH